MSLDTYFEKLLLRVENSLEVQNNGKDINGFYKPTRTLLLRHIQLLKDLHNKPLAKEMVKASWSFVSEELPPDWLILTREEREELKMILG